MNDMEFGYWFGFFFGAVAGFALGLIAKIISQDWHERQSKEGL